MKKESVGAMEGMNMGEMSEDTELQRAIQESMKDYGKKK